MHLSWAVDLSPNTGMPYLGPSLVCLVTSPSPFECSLKPSRWAPPACGQESFFPFETAGVLFLHRSSSQGGVNFQNAVFSVFVLLLLISQNTVDHEIILDCCLPSFSEKKGGKMICLNSSKLSEFIQLVKMTLKPWTYSNWEWYLQILCRTCVFNIVTELKGKNIVAISVTLSCLFCTFILERPFKLLQFTSWNKSRGFNQERPFLWWRSWSCILVFSLCVLAHE